MVQTRGGRKRAKPTPPTADSAAAVDAQAALPSCVSEDPYNGPYPPPPSGGQPALDDAIVKQDLAPPWDDRLDLKVDPKLFVEVQSKVARPFTLDAFARTDGSNALCQHFCSPERSFFEADHTGQMLWIHPPNELLDSVFDQYVRHKIPSTGAVYVVPKPRGSTPSPWVQFTRKMKMLHEVPRHTKLFCGPLPKCEQRLRSLYDVQLWYDAPGVLPESEYVSVDLETQPSGAVSGRLSLKMQIPVTVAGIPTVAILDTGAQGLPNSDNVYVSQAFCSLHRLKCSPCPDGMPNVLGVVKGEEPL